MTRVLLPRPLKQIVVNHPDGQPIALLAYRNTVALRVRKRIRRNRTDSGRFGLGQLHLA
jgi:hypothetical protein